MNVPKVKDMHSKEFKEVMDAIFRYYANNIVLILNPTNEKHEMIIGSKGHNTNIIFYRQYIIASYASKSKQYRYR